ncbi:MAG: amidohydrolase family protein [Clostridiaceae bacterium]
MLKIYKGNILFSEIPGKLTAMTDSYIVIRGSKVEGVFDRLPEKYEGCCLEVDTKGLIIPGFCDLHVHAPQWMTRGMGYSLELLPWLQRYTFPAEERFSDISFAEKAYGMFVEDLKTSETTRACVFATVHKDSTRLLIEKLRESGLGAFVGKVNMDRNATPGLLENKDVSISETIELMEWIRSVEDAASLVNYIITPRYVPSTTRELMEELGKLAAVYDVPVQSHLNENRSEIGLVMKLHPECRDFTSIYYKYGLLPKAKTVMAHCIYNTEEEMNMLKDQDVLVAHCPQSNVNLSSGIMPLRKYLDMGIRAGIGSDVGGGHSLCISEQIALAIELSKLYWTTHPESKAISFPEAFHMATKGGGSFFGKVGSFEEGYEFDALIIEDSDPDPLVPLSLEERLERYVYTGSMENIAGKYVAGRRIF